MNEMLTYWREMFGEFEESDKVFNIPGFPEPLMSVDFNKSIEGIYFKKFERPELIIQPLEEAIADEMFWLFHEENYPEGVGFLRKLLPFINSYKPGSHKHLCFKENDEIIASQLVGEGKEMSFFFNAVVMKSHRRSGLLKQLLSCALSDIKTRKAFYWTKYEWLGR